MFATFFLPNFIPIFDLYNYLICTTEIQEDGIWELIKKRR